MYQPYETKSKTDFENAMENENYAINLYLNERNKFNSMELEERAYLAEKWLVLTITILSNSDISDEDITVLTSTFSKDEVAHFEHTSLNRYPAIVRKNISGNEQIAQTIANIPKIVATLDENSLVELAYYNAILATRLLSSEDATTLPSSVISKLAATSVTRQSHLDNLICFQMLTEKFLDKLNPASKLLVFAKIQLLAPTYPERFSKLLKQLQLQINRSYSLPVNTTNYFAIPAGILILAGLSRSDHATIMFKDILSYARGSAFKNPTDLQTRAAEVIALILITDSRFLCDSEQDHTSPPYVAQLSTEDRVQLGLLYPKIAYQLLTNPTCQGSRSFTSVEKCKLVEKHGQAETISPRDFISNWFRAKHNAFRSATGATCNTALCTLYEQHQNWIEGNDVDFRKVSSLRALSAHAFLRSTHKSSLPLELAELSKDIDNFEKINFQM